mgnify:CR=1 FL=1
MSTLDTADEKFPETLLRSTINFILTTQNEDGSIPWFTNGKTDPWNHTEAAMGLSIGGEHRAAANSVLTSQLEIEWTCDMRGAARHGAQRTLRVTHAADYRPYS